MVIYSHSRIDENGEFIRAYYGTLAEAKQGWFDAVNEIINEHTTKEEATGYIGGIRCNKPKLKAEFVAMLNIAAGN